LCRTSFSVVAVPFIFCTNSNSVLQMPCPQGTHPSVFFNKEDLVGIQRPAHVSQANFDYYMSKRLETPVYASSIPADELVQPLGFRNGRQYAIHLSLSNA
jgi:hypothetical protein